jgi:hypothetical protein
MLCPKCKTDKPPEDFYVNRRKKSGRQWACKACFKLLCAPGHARYEQRYRRPHINGKRVRVLREQNPP